MHKTNAKNKASKQVHTQCQNAKKQVIKQTNNCARWTCQHDKKCYTKTWAKNRNTHFAITHWKKQENTRGKSPKPKYTKIACKKEAPNVAQNCKTHAFNPTRVKLARCQRRDVSKSIFLKIKPPGLTTNEIVEIFSPGGGYYIPLHTLRGEVVEK